MLSESKPSASWCDGKFAVNGVPGIVDTVTREDECEFASVLTKPLRGAAPLKDALLDLWQEHISEYDSPWTPRLRGLGYRQQRAHRDIISSTAMLVAVHPSIEPWYIDNVWEWANALRILVDGCLVVDGR